MTKIYSCIVKARLLIEEEKLIRNSNKIFWNASQIC